MTLLLQCAVTVPSIRIIVLIGGRGTLEGYAWEFFWAVIFAVVAAAWGLFWWAEISPNLPQNWRAALHDNKPLVCLTIVSAGALLMAACNNDAALSTQIPRNALLIFGMNIFFDFLTIWQKFKDAKKNGLKNCSFTKFCNMPTNVKPSNAEL